MEALPWAASPPRSPPPGAAVLGFDVAGMAPFYSLIADMPDPAAYPEFVDAARSLNEHGLFASEDAAARCLEAYRAAWDRVGDELEEPAGERVWLVALASDPVT